MHVESKDEYKARNAGKSPDEMDAVVMLLHLIRMRGGVIAGIVEQQNNKSDRVIKAYSPTTDRSDVEEPLELGSEPDDNGEELAAVDLS
jgi:hypothetical protein